MPFPDANSHSCSKANSIGIQTSTAMAVCIMRTPISSSRGVLVLGACRGGALAGVISGSRGSEGWVEDAGASDPGQVGGDFSQAT